MLNLAVPEVQSSNNNITIVVDPQRITLDNFVAGQLSQHTRKAYQTDAGQFITWLTARSASILTANRQDIVEYRRYLADNFNKSTAGRKLTVARKLLDEAVIRELITTSPAQGVRGYRSQGQAETPYMVLTRHQARDLVDSIDQETLKGKRDYALIMLLLKTGLRRSEAAALNRTDLGQEQGHSVASIRHGKGDKPRRVKVPPDVTRALIEYLEALDQHQQQTDDVSAGQPSAVQPISERPLFVQVRKGDQVQFGQRVSDGGIGRIIKARARAASVVGLTPHGLRASFITLAIEGGARLDQVQYAAGHADPRTTERYQKRKGNLDNNAVDYIHF